MSKELLNPEKALIFRIVHRDNLGKVLANGCLCRSAIQGQESYVEIGNQELIQRRVSREVPCGPGGTLSDYVPFYFTPYSPMMYNIKTGMNVPRKPMAEIVILVSSLLKMVETGTPFVFTDRHAYLKAAQFSTDLADLSRIAWPALQARNFRRDASDNFEKYQAEALIHNHVPLSALEGIVCHNADVRASVQAQASAHNANIGVYAKPSWYL